MILASPYNLLTVSLCGRVPGVLEYNSLSDDERRGLRKMSGGLMLGSSSPSSLGRAQAGGRMRPGAGAAPKIPP